jgi:hypothetical protein
MEEHAQGMQKKLIELLCYSGLHLIFVHVLLSDQHIFVIAHIIYRCCPFLLILMLIFYTYFSINKEIIKILGSPSCIISCVLLVSVHIGGITDL